MNILYIIQQSIYDNNRKWLTADSNVNMAVGIFRELCEKTDWKIYALIGKLSDFKDIKSYDEIFKHKNVTFIPYDFPVDAFLNRQNFSITEFDKLFSGLKEKNIQIDVIVNNIAELSRNIKTYLLYRKIPAKLITACYWLDCPTIGQEKVDKSISYDWRQFDGFECSDLAVFTCESTRKVFVENAKNKFYGVWIKKILDKSTIWDFGFSQNELSTYFTERKYRKKTIMFLNRMSEINYTNHLEFISAVNKLAEKRDDFQVMFTNPSQKISWDWLKKNVKNLYVESELPLNREQYIKMLWSGDISVHLYTKELYGGCAHRESTYCRNIIVCPKVNEYARIHGHDHEFYVKEDLSNLEEVLNRALDKVTTLKLNVTWDANKRNSESSFEAVSEKVIEDVRKVCQSS